MVLKGVAGQNQTHASATNAWNTISPMQLIQLFISSYFPGSLLTVLGKIYEPELQKQCLLSQKVKCVLNCPTICGAGERGRNVFILLKSTQ